MGAKPRHRRAVARHRRRAAFGHPRCRRRRAVRRQRHQPFHESHPRRALGATGLRQIAKRPQYPGQPHARPCPSIGELIRHPSRRAPRRLPICGQKIRPSPGKTARTGPLHARARPPPAIHVVTARLVSGLGWWGKPCPGPSRGLRLSGLAGISQSLPLRGQRRPLTGFPILPLRGGTLRRPHYRIRRAMHDQKRPARPISAGTAAPKMCGQPGVRTGCRRWPRHSARPPSSAPPSRSRPPACRPRCRSPRHSRTSGGTLARPR